MSVNAWTPRLRWPCSVPRDVVCLTSDVDWATQPVIDDLLDVLAGFNLRATFFCTHAGIDVRGHDRGIHPNFRRDGDTVRALMTEDPGFEARDDVARFTAIVARTKAFAPEAIGVRAHSLHTDTLLISIYRAAGLTFDSSYLMPLAPNLQPVWREFDLLQIPIWFNDHFELKTGAADLDVRNLPWNEPGLKVINFHPNMFFLNCRSNEDYLNARSSLQDPDRLRRLRRPGRGIRTFYEDLFRKLVREDRPVMLISAVERSWRDAGSVHPEIDFVTGDGASSADR